MQTTPAVVHRSMPAPRHLTAHHPLLAGGLYPAIAVYLEGPGGTT